MTDGMSMVEQEIRSTPAHLRMAAKRVTEQGGALAGMFGGPLVFLGCGSSYCIAIAAATLYEAAFGQPAGACIASEIQPRAGWTYVAISRTGQTTELVEAMRRARAGGARVGLLCGALQSPAAEYADVVVPMEFAAETSVIQTRFIAVALFTLRLLIGGPRASEALDHLSARMDEAIGQFDPTPLTDFDQFVFLGRGWRLGVALMSALNLQETALLSPNGYQTLEYRHGPLAAADVRTLAWCYDPPDDPLSAGVLQDVRAAGATVRCTADDPLIIAALAQLVAVHVASLRGIDPDAPRNLSRAIVVPHEMPLIGVLS